MIVRVAGQGQYRIPDSDQEKLNELDNAAVEAGDEDRFHEHFEEMLAIVRGKGAPLDGDTLAGSDGAD